MRGIIGMNLPKLLKEDVPLFEGLFNDLFPGVDLIENENLKLKNAIKTQLKDQGYKVYEYSV